jgi:hypothetical protein
VTPPNPCPSALFREVQRFKQLWLWAILLIPTAVSWYIFVQQIVLGRPQGHNPAPDWLTAVLLAIFGLGFPIFFAELRLVTEVSSRGLRIGFAPFPLRVFGPGEIVSAQATDYHPLRTYGGWGVRYSSAGKAYNVCGHRGVRLMLTNGHQLLVGSQRPDELEAALRASGLLSRLT